MRLPSTLTTALRMRGSNRARVREDVLPRWGSTKITDFDKNEYKAMLCEFVDAGRPVRARTVRDVMRGMYSYLIEEEEVWASLNEETREAALVIATLNRRKPVDLVTMCRIAEHLADDPIAVMCIFGIVPPPPRVWSKEQTATLRLCARIEVQHSH